MKSRGYLLIDALILLCIVSLMSFEIYSLNRTHQSYFKAYQNHQVFNETFNEEYTSLP